MGWKNCWWNIVWMKMIILFEGYIKTTRELDDIRNLFREHYFTEVLMYYSEEYHPSDCMIDMVLYKNKRC